MNRMIKMPQLLQYRAADWRSIEMIYTKAIQEKTRYVKNFGQIAVSVPHGNNKHTIFRAISFKGMS